jgi:hypothetical protein
VKTDGHKEIVNMCRVLKPQTKREILQVRAEAALGTQKSKVGPPIELLKDNKRISRKHVFNSKFVCRHKIKIKLLQSNNIKKEQFHI